MKITRDDRDDVTLFTIAGRLDSLTEASLKDAVKRAGDEGHHRIVVDMAGVEFIDSSGLGALISSLMSTREHQGDLRVCNLTEQVQMVFKVMRLDKVFNIFDSAGEALESFS